MLQAGDDHLSIGHSSEDGDESWICSIDKNGVTVFPNSAYGPEHLSGGLREGQEIVLPSLTDEIINARLINLVANMTKGNAWEENPDWPVADWQYEVGNDDTRIGYLEWVKHKEEGAE